MSRTTASGTMAFGYIEFVIAAAVATMSLVEVCGLWSCSMMYRAATGSMAFV